jgi:hypothetical protein
MVVKSLRTRTSRLEQRSHKKPKLFKQRNLYVKYLESIQLVFIVSCFNKILYLGKVNRLI